LYKLVIDTSTFFSAIYNPNGNEAQLFELADKGICKIYIVDYVLEEMKEVFKRKNIDFKLVLELMDTYDNIIIQELVDLSDKEIKLVKEMINDPEDRSIFIYAKRMIDRYKNTYFISGDKGFFKKEVSDSLKNKVLKTKEIIKKMK
jgi:predicted nucleic acid-binding protein